MKLEKVLYKIKQKLILSKLQVGNDFYCFKDEVEYKLRVITRTSRNIKFLLLCAKSYNLTINYLPYEFTYGSDYYDGDGMYNIEIGNLTTDSRWYSN